MHYTHPDLEFNNIYIRECFDCGYKGTGTYSDEHGYVMCEPCLIKRATKHNQKLTKVPTSKWVTY